MITTRIREVAIHAGCISPLEPRLLNEDESLVLLRKKALPQHPHFPDNLKNLGKEMVNKCGGLPLAVVVLGGLLSGKPQEQWKNLYGNSRWRVMNDEDRVPLILSLSYNYLPFHLKLCFQHLAIYPEDHCIPKKELIRLWVAERFLPLQGEDTEEGVAENCIYELINRSMVLVATRTSMGSIKAIRIHDVLRDFSISKAVEGKFLQIYSGKEVGTPTSNNIESRRIAIHGTYNVDYAFLEPHTLHIRSLHFFSRVHRKMDFVYKNSKLLNVLEVYGSTYQGKQDYTVLGNLTQLRYLAFKGNTHMDHLPSSFGKLLNLQTLDLRECVIMHAIPDILWKMKRLRHLLLNSKQECGELRLDTLIFLRTLTGVYGGRWLKAGLAKMIHMRQLGIRLKSTEEANLCISTAVSTLRHLRSLSITLAHGNIFPPTLVKLFNCDNLQKLHLDGEIENLDLSKCVSLQKLHLAGKIENLELSNCVDLQNLQLDGMIEKGPNEFFPNLVKISLNLSELKEDLIATLEKLRSLKMLMLNAESSNLRELHLSSDGFPQLEVLHLVGFRNASEWIIEEGALMNIKHMKLREFWALRNVPVGFESLTTLEEVDIDVSYEFVNGYKSNRSFMEFVEKYSIKLMVK